MDVRNTADDIVEMHLSPWQGAGANWRWQVRMVSSPPPPRADEWDESLKLLRFLFLYFIKLTDTSFLFYVLFAFHGCYRSPTNFIYKTCHLYFKQRIMPTDRHPQNSKTTLELSIQVFFPTFLRWGRYHSVANPPSPLSWENLKKVSIQDDRQRNMT